jgi:nicotinate-nucleotide pyrophosphorylase (carboxylating)
MTRKGDPGLLPVLSSRGQRSGGDRRRRIEQVLSAAGDAVAGDVLAERFGVSRQAIVHDIALLRAAGRPILSTVRGYVLGPIAARRFRRVAVTDGAAPVDPADLRRWIAEDLGTGDVTSSSVVPAGMSCTATILLKEPGVVCGLGVVAAVFREIDPAVDFEARGRDGEPQMPGIVAVVRGPANAVLAGERLALNLFGRMCGVATLTRRYVDAVAGTRAVILDTRKTTPGLRLLEKAAVRCGGGTNHRFGLHDGILVKDNHLRLAGSIRAAVEGARTVGLPVEVECETLDQVREALEVGVDRILLDNMAPPLLAEAVSLVAGRAELEASGGVTLANVRAVAETGVDFVSIGALTHAARALDVSLELEP